MVLTSLPRVWRIGTILCLMGVFAGCATDKISRSGPAEGAPGAASRAQLECVATLLNRAVPDCLVTGFEGLEAALVALPDPNHRHVLAVAIAIPHRWSVTIYWARSVHGTSRPGATATVRPRQSWGVEQQAIRL